MERPRIITLGGKPGSGKSSTADGVARALGYSRFSSGDFMRTVAEERGLTLAELQKEAETDPSIDHDIDAEVRAAGTNDRVVIDSRMAFHWIPSAYKVFLDLDPATAAARIFADQTDARKKSGEVAETAAALEASVTHRLASDQKRYEQLYGVNPLDLTQYDLVIDTSKHPLHEVIEMVAEGYRNWCQAHQLTP